MKPDICFLFDFVSVHLLPVVHFDWGLGWYKLRITIGWLFWAIEIDWPIE